MYSKDRVQTPYVGALIKLDDDSETHSGSMHQWPSDSMALRKLVPPCLMVAASYVKQKLNSKRSTLYYSLFILYIINMALH